MSAKIGALALGALCLWLAACGGCGGDDPEARSRAQSPRPAPAFELRDLAGRVVRLQDFRGKVVLLDFWATYCGPCRELIPEFQRMYEKFRGRGLEVVGVNMDADAALAAEYARTLKMGYTVLLDPENRTRTPFGVRGLPTTLLLDRSGAVRRRWVGYDPEGPREIERDVEALLKES